ncbi:unnamed protein product [Urochloa decumbens]|uniref:F-box domain-containing protein n=1 Tax=Urochloa decumbens TaxID=240449 RepID=A0ABC9F1M0_9POAL
MGSTSPPAIPVADDCKPPKKRTTWCSDQQSVQSHGGISALPDDILIKILSLMTIREAALTDCLSTRWRHLWKKVKNVILDKHNFGMQTIANPNIHENSDLLNRSYRVSASSAEKIFISLHDKHDIGAPQQSEPYKFPLKEFVDMRDYCRLRVLFLSMCSLETLVAMEVNGCKSLISINIHAKNLEGFSYMSHKVDIEYECAPVLSELNVHFVKRNECPLDCIGTLPALQTLTVQFPSRLQESHVLHHNGRFTGLKEMVLCLMKSWGKSNYFSGLSP